MKIPAFNAEFPLTDGMGFHGECAVDLAVNCLEENAAACAAVGAN